MKIKDPAIKDQSSDCSVTININTSGPVNIYNCGKEAGDKGCKDQESTDQECSTAKGACVPASLGAKPKQSQEQKLNRLLKNNPVPSALAASFLHTCKRFIAGKKAANELESKMFNTFEGLSPEIKKILKCTLRSYDDLPSKYKALFAGNLMRDINTAVSPDSLGQAFGQEISGIINTTILGNREAPLVEVPGKVRLYEYGTGDDVYPPQVHIFKVNDLRTNDNIPALAVGDFLPEEFQQTCTPRREDDHAEWDCQMQRPPCDGWSMDDNCLRVPQVQSGTSAHIVGVNFFDVNTKIQYRMKEAADYREVDAFVLGDVQTPVTEVVNGEEKLIADSRVQDKIFFTIPADTAPGIYEFLVAVPNTSGFSGPGFGDVLTSFSQYIEVVPPDTARFQIASQSLWARKETSPAWWGSDEVGIKINAVPVFGDLSLGDMQENTFRFGDVDSEETRQMEGVLFSHTQPIAGVILGVIGYEIDGEDAYENQITEWTDIFYDLVKEEWKIIMASEVAQEIIKKLINSGFWGYVILGIAIAITLLVDLFVALWAPADLIIQDTLGLSVTDLARMTNINFPAPAADSDTNLYTTGGDIHVRLMFTDKIANEYTEERGYLSDDEDSWYNITFRYDRTA